MTIVGDFDIAQLCLYAFWLFFFGLIVYLQREAMREGYPMESELTGKPFMAGPFGDIPEPKVFKLPFGRGEVSYPNPEKDALEITDREIKMRRTAPWAGSPYEATGDNPLLDGVGPAAWAERRDEIELTLEGAPRIVPLRTDDEWGIAEGDRDIRGWAVMGCDGEKAGTVGDLWVDRGESLLRYVEVAIEGGPTVLCPFFCIVLDVRAKAIKVDSIRSDQFADVPQPKSDVQITKLEEEKVMAYYAGGKLFASKERQEPWL